jgi:hypothetical protein
VDHTQPLRPEHGVGGRRGRLERRAAVWNTGDAVPELPEVETTRRQLAPLLIGRTIVRVRATRASHFFLTPPARLARALTGRRVDELRRVGKYLVAHLDDGARFLMHLGMTARSGPPVGRARTWARL